MKNLSDQHNNELDIAAVLNEALKLSLDTENPYLAISAFIECFGKAIKCDRIFVFERQDSTSDTSEYLCTYEWTAPGLESFLGAEINLSQSQALSQFQPDYANLCSLNNLQLIYPESETNPKSSFRTQLRNSCIVGLRSHGQLLGLLGVENTGYHATDNASTHFEIIAQYIVSIMRWRDLYKKLDHLSNFDELTGLGNRRNFVNYVSSINANSEVGLIYFDVMGLKAINDAQGHAMGDKLLIRAANCLKESFPEANIFRMGGDEFLVIQTGKSMSQIQANLETLKNLASKNDANMASGISFGVPSKVNIHDLLVEADNNMYADKRRLYSKQK